MRLFAGMRTRPEEAGMAVNWSSENGSSFKNLGKIKRNDFRQIVYFISIIFFLGRMLSPHRSGSGGGAVAPDTGRRYPGLFTFLSGIVVGVLAVLTLNDNVGCGGGVPQGAVVARARPCSAATGAQDPSALGEATHLESGRPWPAEFRTWLVDKPEALSDLFRERAMVQGTDKTTTHRYQYMYAKYLLPVRHRELKLLEIGLGCDTEWGAGHSVDLWHELLPRMTYYSIELDGGCASKFIPRLGARQFIGSQDDAAFLARVTNSTGPVDVVIDDGSHFSEHQRATFALLWHSIKPGGLYVIEDLQCAFLGGYHGEQTGMATGGSTRMIVEVILALLGRARQHDSDDLAYTDDFVQQIASVDCFREACVFVKAGYPEPLKGKSHIPLGR